MRQLTRRLLIRHGLASAAVASALPLRAQGAKISYKLGHVMPPQHPLSTCSVEASKRVREETNGELEITLFPNSALGGDTEMISQVRSGALEMLLTSGGVLSRVVPVASICNVAFLFKNYEEVWRAIDGELGAHVRGQISKTMGVHVLDKTWDFGFRVMSSGRTPIRTPADLKNFKMRVPSGALYVKTFQALGASPVSMNFGELYTALQAGVVDGQEVPLSSFEIAKFGEVQKHVAMTRHMWDGPPLCINGQAWSKLPERFQTIVANAFNDAAVKARSQVAALEVDVRKRLEKTGISFTDPDPELFKAKLREAKYYAFWKETYGAQAWAVVEKYSGKLS